MVDTAERIRLFQANSIKLVIDRKVGEAKDEALREQYRQRICEALGFTNRYAFILNNTSQPTLRELTVFAQVLGVTLDELVVLDGDRTDGAAHA